jgi:hypothetical protein
MTKLIRRTLKETVSHVPVSHKERTNLYAETLRHVNSVMVVLFIIDIVTVHEMISFISCSVPTSFLQMFLNSRPLFLIHSHLCL